jgi:hypothetical protein
LRSAAIRAPGHERWLTGRIRAAVSTRTASGRRRSRGQRPPLEPGHELTVRHGAYSQLRLTQRAGEIVDEFRELVSRYRASDEPMVRLLAVTWARVEAAAEALEKADGPEQPSRLERDLRAWVRVARQLLTDRGSRRRRVRGWASTSRRRVRGAITACPSTLSRVEREFRRLNTNTDLLDRERAACRVCIEDAWYHAELITFAWRVDPHVSHSHIICPECIARAVPGVPYPGY